MTIYTIFKNNDINLFFDDEEKKLMFQKNNIYYEINITTFNKNDMNLRQKINSVYNIVNAMKISGKIGPRGDDGKRGPIGPIGPKGPKGDKGDLNIVNIKYYEKSLNDLPNPKNILNNDIIFAVTTEDFNLYLLKNKNWEYFGNLIKIGLKGEKGCKGEKGDKGDQFLVNYIFKDISSLSDTSYKFKDNDYALIKDIGDLYLYYNEKWYFLLNIKGEKGDKGDKGDNLKIDKIVDSVDVISKFIKKSDNNFLNFENIDYDNENDSLSDTDSNSENESKNNSITDTSDIENNSENESKNSSVTDISVLSTSLQTDCKGNLNENLQINNDLSNNVLSNNDLSNNVLSNIDDLTNIDESNNAFLSDKKSSNNISKKLNDPYKLLKNDTILVKESMDLYFRNGDTFENVGSLKGHKGDRGDKGEKGDKGNIGKGLNIHYYFNKEIDYLNSDKQFIYGDVIYIREKKQIYFWDSNLLSLGHIIPYSSVNNSTELSLYPVTNSHQGISINRLFEIKHTLVSSFYENKYLIKVVICWECVNQKINVEFFKNGVLFFCEENGELVRNSTKFETGYPYVNTLKHEFIMSDFHVKSLRFFIKINYKEGMIKIVDECCLFQISEI